MPSDDPAAFADAQERAVADRPQEMGRNVQGHTADRFDRQRLADGFVTWLEGIGKG